jgi:hypothetical protein
MKLLVGSTAIVAAVLALSAIPAGLAMPMPQATNPLGGLSSLISNIPIIGSLLGGGNSTNLHVPAPGSGMEGLLSSGQIIGDHIKYSVDPPSALQPIPASQNSPPRELHRQAHAALVGNQGAK